MKIRAALSTVTVLVVFGGMLAAEASAQVYKYRDPVTGKTVLTDKPPKGAAPASGSPAAEAEDSDTDKAEVVAKPKVSGTDPRLEARKREEEAQARAKQEAEAEQLKERKRAYCADLARGIRTLESGQRIVRMNEAGNREFMGDEERNQELEKRRAELANCED